MKKFVDRLRQNAVPTTIVVSSLLVLLAVSEINDRATEARMTEKIMKSDTEHCTNVLNGEYSSINSRTAYCYGENGEILKKYVY